MPIKNYWSMRYTDHSFMEGPTTPLRPFLKLKNDAIVDLHFHSVSMARAAMRCCFSDMLRDYDKWSFPYAFKKCPLRR